MAKQMKTSIQFTPAMTFLGSSTKVQKMPWRLFGGRQGYCRVGGRVGFPTRLSAVESTPTPLPGSG